MQIPGKPIQWIYSKSNPEKLPDGSVTWYGFNTDITERKLAEELLLRNTKLLEESQGIAKVGGWELDLILNKLFWTAETYKIHETSPEEFNPTVDAGVGYFLPESKLIISEALEQAIKYGIGYDLYLETYTTKGKIINVRTTCDVTLDNGTPIKLTGIFQDITDIKQAEKALLIAKEKAEESENKLKVMVNAMPDLVWFKDINGTYLECNLRFEEFIGFGQDQLIGKTDHDLFDKELADFFRKHDQIAMDAGKSTLNEEQITFASDRHTEFLETIKTPIYDPNNNVIGVLGIGRNITTRKQAELLLKEKEERHSAITQTAHDGIITANSKGIITGWNNAAEKIFGHPKADIIGKTLTEIIPTHFKDLHEKCMERFENNGEKRVIGKTVELEGLHKNGTVFPIELSLAAWETTSGKFVTGFIKDITERKKAEIELEKNLSTVRKLSLAIDQSPVTKVITDLDGKIVFVNPKFTEVTGYTFDEAIGQNPSVLNSGHTPKEYYKKLWETILSGQNWHGVFQNKKKNGELFWENAVISPVKNEQGIITNFLAVKEDITKKRLAELALLESNERYNLVAKATNDSIWDLNILTNEIVRSGNGFEVLFGYKITEDNLDYPYYKNLIHPDDLERVIASKTQVFSNPNEFNWEEDYRFLKANGEYAIVHDKGYIIRDDNGKAIRMIGATQDITEREQHIKSIEAQNKKLRDIAWKQSHIVRAPVARIMGLINLLSDEKSVDDETNNLLKFIEESAKELDSIIRSIVDNTITDNELNSDFDKKTNYKGGDEKVS